MIRLLFETFKMDRETLDLVNASSIRNLAETIQETTAMFNSSMTSLQLRIVSLYAEEGNQYGNINTVRSTRIVLSSTIPNHAL